MILRLRVKLNQKLYNCSVASLYFNSCLFGGNREIFSRGVVRIKKTQSFFLESQIFPSNGIFAENPLWQHHHEGRTPGVFNGSHSIMQPQPRTDAATGSLTKGFNLKAKFG